MLVFYEIWKKIFQKYLFSFKPNRRKIEKGVFYEKLFSWKKNFHTFPRNQIALIHCNLVSHCQAIKTSTLELVTQIYAAIDGSKKVSPS